MLTDVSELVSCHNCIHVPTLILLAFKVNQYGLQTWPDLNKFVSFSWQLEKITSSRKLNSSLTKLHGKRVLKLTSLMMAKKKEMKVFW